MNFNTLTYRAYFAARDLRMAAVLRRAPRLARSVKRLIGLILPQTPAWVQVRSGISQGMWMRLHLPDESRLWRGEHEVVVQSAILAAVGPGAVVYDIGAHAGSIALGVARLVGPSGSVIAFEADPANVLSLQENAFRNRLTTSLRVVHGAVWSGGASDITFRRSGVRRSHGGVETASQHPVLGTGELINVPAVTLDDFISSGGPTPQLVKVDVEGGEYEVLCGASSLFTKSRPLLIAEVHHPKADEQIRAWLVDHRYAAKWMIPAERFPCCLFAWPEEFDGTTWMSKFAIDE
ncbi:MAG: FkbM family methyltransferase [Terriglobales bacterium]|jgi:FkbM family methyltransferase